MGAEAAVDGTVTAADSKKGRGASCFGWPLKKATRIPTRTINLMTSTHTISRRRDDGPQRGVRAGPEGTDSNMRLPRKNEYSEHGNADRESFAIKKPD